MAINEREGILTKSPDQAHKQKFVYNLTLKGIDLLPIMKEIGSWSLKHTPRRQKAIPSRRPAFEVHPRRAA
ncbi:MAG: hypothetical protein J0H07_14260 [Sphingobacteriales bacterium]|nr:hypothetical protein [Sphingobacteriales bacterium]